jgi:DNA-binding transcriptional MerR regulator
MIYTVEQVANKLNVSKVTIYNKLKLNQFRDKTVTKQGQTMIDDDLVNLIKDSLKFTNRFTDNIDIPIEPEGSMEENKNPQDININDDVLNINKELVKALLEQLKEKDVQLNNSNERLKQEQELNKNNQVLQLRQPQETKQLEEHFALVDEKLIEIKDKMQKKEKEHKGIFKKIFSK